MNKNIFSVSCICFIILFFVANHNVVTASDTYIEEYPTSSEIMYGQPLFESSFNGGVTSIEGSFEWVNGLIVLCAGENVQRVRFIPNDTSKKVEEFDMNINVNKRRVTVKFESELFKQYDGKSSLILPNYVVVGIIDKGVYVRGELEGKLENALVGSNVKVSFDGVELVGDVEENYFLDLDGFTATIHPKYIEKFGLVKNRIDFGEGIYVPVSSSIYVESINNDDFVKKGFDIVGGYYVTVRNNNAIIDINKKVSLKIKVDDNFNKKRINVFNYYNGKYEEIEYSYVDGYLMCLCNGLGTIVIAKKEFNYWWIYIFVIIIFLMSMCLIIKTILANKKKINRYKSLKRRKNNGNYL